MSIPTENGDNVKIKFSNYTAGASVIEAMFKVSNPQAIDNVATSFIQSGDPSVMALLQKLAAHYPEPGQEVQ